MKPTAGQLGRQKPRMAYKGRPNARMRKGGGGKKKDGYDDADQGNGPVNPALANIEYVLDRMNTRMGTLEDDMDTTEQSEKTMASLISMVNNVMQTYEQ